MKQVITFYVLTIPIVSFLKLTSTGFTELKHSRDPLQVSNPRTLDHRSNHAYIYVYLNIV